MDPKDTTANSELNRDPEIARQTRPIPAPLRRQATWVGAMARVDIGALAIAAGVALFFVFPPVGLVLLVLGLLVLGVAAVERRSRRQVG